MKTKQILSFYEAECFRALISILQGEREKVEFVKLQKQSTTTGSSFYKDPSHRKPKSHQLNMKFSTAYYDFTLDQGERRAPASVYSCHQLLLHKTELSIITVTSVHNMQQQNGYDSYFALNLKKILSIISHSSTSKHAPFACLQATCLQICSDCTVVFLQIWSTASCSFNRTTVDCSECFLPQASPLKSLFFNVSLGSGLSFHCHLSIFFSNLFLKHEQLD